MSTPDDKNPEKDNGQDEEISQPEQSDKTRDGESDLKSVPTDQPSENQQTANIETSDADLAKTPSSKPEPKFQAPTLSTIYDGQPFTDLVRNLETFIGDRAVDQFQPFLNLCGHSQGLSRLSYGQQGESSESGVDLSEPFALRHIHSTPLVHTASMLDDEDEDEPPPLGVEILTRSRSTPLSTSANSAFGTINRPNLPYMNGPDDRSAFTLPPYRLKPSLSNDRVSAHLDVFNPITYDVDRETDTTAIEVMDVPQVQVEKAATSPSRKGLGSKTATRAAKFLSEVRSIRRRRRVRSGRENPARPPSVSDDSEKKSSGDDETLSSKSASSNIVGASFAKKIFSGKGQRGKDKSKNETGPDSSGESSIGVQSPATIVSQAENNTESQESQRVGRVRIQISHTEEVPISQEREQDSLLVASPIPSHVVQEGSPVASHLDSPETSRSYGTSQTSGHTTLVTNTSNSSGHVSQLSAISETDREVMEVNKTGPSRSTGKTGGRSDGSQTPSQLRYIEVSDSPASLRDGANVPAERFFRFGDSPSYRVSMGGRLRTSSSLRRNPSSQSPTTVSSSSMTTNSSNSSQEEPPKFVSYLDRKTTSDLTSLRETDERSSPRTGGGTGEERESSPSALLGYSDVIFEAAKAPGEEPSAATRPSPIWPNRGFQLGRKVRSLPPRSPHKGLKRATTPPPGSGAVSPAYDALSPPREIVNHRIDPNVSRPYVLRSTPASTRLLPSRRVSPQVLSTFRNVNYAHIPEGSPDLQGAYEVVRMGTDYDMSRSYYMAHPRATSPNTAARSRTYDEHSIEILKTDSKEDTSPTLVTPERCPSN